YRETISALRRDLSHERLHGFGPFPSVLARFFLSRCLVELGHVREAAEIIDEAIEIADGLDDAWGRLLSYTGRAEVDIHRGEATRAVAVSARALDLCTTNIPFLFPIVASTHGWALARSRRIDDGIALLERAVESARAMGIAHEGSLLRVRLA